MSEHNPQDVRDLEDKMNKMFDDVLGRSNGLVKVAHPSAAMSNNAYRKYKSSFLTLGDMQIPDDYRQIFRWCRYFFKFDSLIGAAVRSLATFPITDIIYNDTKESEADDTSDESSESYKFYTNMFKEVDLYKHLIEVGYDYFLYGNCIIFAEPGVKVVRRRDETGAITESKEVTWKNIERLDVTRVRIERDPQTKEKIYYYEVPPEIRRIIQTKKPLEKYNRIPKIFKDAVEKKGIVKLKSEYIYHLSMPAESGDSGLWATPPVMHAMKLILYKNILRQAQEALAYEHIVPRRIYFFQETNQLAPEFKFAEVADDFAFELRKQLNDPNYQVISPIPVQQIQHGGNGRALLLVPEIDQLDKTILASMGLPYEFIFGGVSYSGSTTSLRIVENQFITYRILLDNYINEFLIKRLAKLRGEWEVPDDDDKVISTEFSELKMQDDIQQKQLMIQLNQAQKLPDEILYEKVFGLDAQKTFDMLVNEQIRKMQDQARLQIAQIQIQQDMQKKLMELGIDPAILQPADPNAAGGDPNAAGGDPNAAGGDPNVVGDQGQAAAQAPQMVVQPQAGAEATAQPQQKLDETKAEEIARSLMDMTEPEQANVISKLPQADAQMVMHFYYKLEDEQKNQQVDMSPMPTQLPPRRQGGV